MKQFFIILLCVFFPTLISAQILQWTVTQGPYSTQVNAFASASGSLYAGTNTGLYKSTNGGDLWAPVYAVTGIVRDVLIKDTNIYVGGGNGVMISTDAGLTWAVRDSGLPQFSLVYVLKTSHDTLYACLGGEGFFRSLDNGLHWETPGNGLENKSIFSMISTGSSLILASGAGTLRSTNNGFTWDEQSGALENLAVHCFIQQGALLYAGTDGGVFRSSDDGVTWVASRDGMNGNDDIVALTLLPDKITLFAGASNLTGDVGIYRSIDGISWKQINNGLADPDIRAFHPGANKIFVGTSTGISRTDNKGDLWRTASDGFAKQAVTSLGSIYHIVFAGTNTSFAFGTVDAGNNWSIHKKGFTRPKVNAILGVGLSFFAGTDAVVNQGNGGLHVTTDYGTTWKQVKNGLPVMNISLLAGNGSKMFAAGDSGVYSSLDKGANWEKSSSTIAKALYTNGTTDMIASATEIFTYYSGTGWTPIGTFDLKNRSFGDILMNNSSLLVGTDSGVYQSTNNGLNWQILTGDTLNVQKLWANGLLMAAGTTTGIYLSSDGGNTWQFQESAGKVSINGFTSTGGNLYAATNAGVIKTALGTFAVKSSSQKNLFLLQARNTSLNNTEIKFKILDHGFTSLIAYDLLGRECATIMQGVKDPGEYELNWNSSSLTSGTYVLRLSSDNEQATAIISVIH